MQRCAVSVAAALGDTSGGTVADVDLMEDP
jgi:hypothetical protein